MFGLINLYKPPGVTSRDCVNAVSKNLGTRKVGHAGTLDPIAEGVVIIAVGRATRLIEYVQRQPKTYRGGFLLGRQNASCDTETEAVEVAIPDDLSLQLLQTACDQQVGRIQQVPPTYSAVKINGKRAYDLARKGLEVEMPPRLVDVYQCKVTKFQMPTFELFIECGSGTYVRSIGRDVARSVGTDAVMTSLCREAIGNFSHKAAVPLEYFRSKEPRFETLQPLTTAIYGMAEHSAAPNTYEALMNGQLVDIQFDNTVDELAILDEQGCLRSIAVRSGNLWRALKNFDEKG